MSDHTPMFDGAEAVGDAHTGYELRRLVSSGPAGEVHETVDPDGNPCMVTILPASVGSDPTAVACFVHGCELAVRFTDPHLMRVKDFVVEGDLLAVVTEPTPGRTLRDVLDAAGTLPPAVATGLCADLLSGLASMHAFGLAHRDVTPDHVIATPGEDRPHAVLVGYELGMVRDLGAASTASLLPAQEYRAPEAWSGQRLTAAADVFSVGMILHELVLGVLPFRQTDLHSAHLPIIRPDGVLDELWDAIVALTAKAPERRPSTAEAAQHLESLSHRLVGLPALPPLIEPASPAIESDPAEGARPALAAAPSPEPASTSSQLLAGAATALAFLAVGGVMVVGSTISGDGSRGGGWSTLDTLDTPATAERMDPGPGDVGGGEEDPSDRDRTTSPMSATPFVLAAVTTAAATEGSSTPGRAAGVGTGAGQPGAVLSAIPVAQFHGAAPEAVPGAAPAPQPPEALSPLWPLPMTGGEQPEVPTPGPATPGPAVPVLPAPASPVSPWQPPLPAPVWTPPAPVFSAGTPGPRPTPAPALSPVPVQPPAPAPAPAPAQPPAPAPDPDPVVTPPIDQPPVVTPPAEQPPTSPTEPGEDLEPIDPTPTDPGPVDPGPVDPGPVDPGPVDPGPVDPGPVDPGPVDPGPVDPGPVDPDPVVTPPTSPGAPGPELPPDPEPSPDPEPTPDPRPEPGEAASHGVGHGAGAANGPAGCAVPDANGDGVVSVVDVVLAAVGLQGSDRGC